MSHKSVAVANAADLAIGRAVEILYFLRTGHCPWLAATRGSTRCFPKLKGWAGKCDVYQNQVTRAASVSKAAVYGLNRHLIRTSTFTTGFISPGFPNPWSSSLREAT